MADDSKEEKRVNAWRISAPRTCKFELHDTDPNFMFAAIQPGDAVLLMSEDGESAWGVRRVFLVRRTSEGSIVYFDREYGFADQELEFVGEGDKRVLRRLDLEIVDQVLLNRYMPRLRTRTTNKPHQFQLLSSRDH